MLPVCCYVCLFSMCFDVLFDDLVLVVRCLMFLVGILFVDFCLCCIVCYFLVVDCCVLFVGGCLLVVFCCS